MRLRIVGEMEETLKVPLGVFKVSLAKAITLTKNRRAQIFNRLDEEVWKKYAFLRSPLHETAPPNLKVQPPKIKENS